MIGGCAARRGEIAPSIQSKGTRIFRPQVLVASVIFALTTSSYAYACDAGYKDYYGRCVEAKAPPAKLLTFLNGYGQKVTNVGDVADLFAPDLPVFDKPGPGRKVIHSWKRPNSSVESEARIERITPDFYYVAVSVYEGPTSCGIEEFKLKGPKTTLRGYVPKTNPQDVPSLWRFTHMSGLC
jgi:hypothetical protein